MLDNYKLSDRKREILLTAVGNYIDNALPITSGNVQSTVFTTLSSATLRNELNALEEMGYLKQLPYVCFPSCEDDRFEGIYKENKKVVVINNYITSKAAGTTFEFAYEITKYLKSESIANHIKEAVFYN